MKMKRTLFAAAVAFALASGSAAGQGVKMTDQQLDQVTAAGAGALSLILVLNPGKANVGHNLNLAAGNHATCINCVAMPTSDGKTGGVLMLQNRKFTVDNPMRRCVGGGIAVFC